MDVRLDSKGRMVIPESLRKKAGLRSGSKLRVRLEKGYIVVAKGGEPREFIEEMEAFLKEGSPVQAYDPLKLKEIWLER